VLDRLTDDEAGRVLEELLRRHPELEAEATKITTRLLATVDFDSVAEDVSAVLDGVGFEEMSAFAGRREGRYVHGSEAAWTSLQDAVDPFIADAERLIETGEDDAALVMVRGIVAGLYALRGSGSEALQWAPDFPLETATDLVSRMGALAGSRNWSKALLRSLVAEAPEWASSLGLAAQPP